MRFLRRAEENDKKKRKKKSKETAWTTPTVLLLNSKLWNFSLQKIKENDNYRQNAEQDIYMRIYFIESHYFTEMVAKHHITFTTLSVAL